MVWTKETSNGYEMRKCRNRVVPYLHGVVLDLGCGNEKIIPQAIGVDLSEKADLQVDLSAPNSLNLFNSNSVDVVFSSHFLEDCIDYKSVLTEMWRVIKPHGKLILYLPHKDYYPNIGHDGANINHKHDFMPETILDALDFASFKVIKNETYSEENEYSFEIILEKLETNNIPIKYNEAKKALIIRYGAYGDMIITTPIYSFLKDEGYHVTVNAIPDAKYVLENNPNIDELVLQQRWAIPNEHLKDYHIELSKKFERVINLCESVERTLLFEERDKELYFLPHKERHELANVNYSDRTLEMAGMSIKGAIPELYLSDKEETMGRWFKNKNKNTFNVMWQLSGSSIHKMYPFADIVMEKLLEKHDDITFYLTAGFNQVQVMDWNHPRVKSTIGKWPIRLSMIMTKFMDLVISPETAVLNASGAFETPKIGLLTHSSIENLTKYFINDYSLESLSECAPCHRLNHDEKYCNVDKKFKLPICMSEGFPVEYVMNQIEKVYDNHTI
jgi:ADP-heptose:LPS heptosyltransferase/predicted SAM-dependent methyltransferase